LTDREFVNQWVGQHGYDLQFGVCAEAIPFFVLIENLRMAKTTGDKAMTCVARGASLDEAFQHMVTILSGKVQS